MPETPTLRADTRLAWVRQVLNRPDISLQPASSDASFRSYWRITQVQPSLILMDAPPPDEDVRPWIDIGRQLARAGVHVPTVHASDPERGFVLIEDFGSTMYLDMLDADNADSLYADAMRALLAMQRHVDASRLPPYDADFLRRELELFPIWFLQQHLQKDVTAHDRDVLDRAFDLLVENAIGQPRCFVHRDYHSRNLMPVTDNAPGVIDFQGALYGPITYDLVSLLRDCYIRWDEARVDAWREHHRQALIEAGLLDAGVDAARFRRWFDLTGLQRHIKVLGIFCRLALRDGKPAYLADLPRVLEYVSDVASRYPELADFCALLDAATRDRELTHTLAQHSGAAS